MIDHAEVEKYALDGTVLEKYATETVTCLPCREQRPYRSLQDAGIKPHV